MSRNDDAPDEKEAVAAATVAQAAAKGFVGGLRDLYVEDMPLGLKLLAQIARGRHGSGLRLTCCVRGAVDGEGGAYGEFERDGVAKVSTSCAWVGGFSWTHSTNWNALRCGQGDGEVTRYLSSVATTTHTTHPTPLPSTKHQEPSTHLRAHRSTLW